MDEPPPLPRLRELADEMIMMVHPGPVSLDMQMKHSNPGRPVAIYGLALGAVRATSTGLQLWESGNHLAAMLSFRFSWEAAITSQWLANTETGAEAMINEQTRLRGLIRTEALASPVYSQHAAESAVPNVENLFTAVKAAGSSFKDRCLAFEDGLSLYVTYRLFSAYCHPGAQFIDEWFDTLPDEGAAVRDVSQLDELTNTAWPAAAVIAAMWSARSFDFFLQGRPHRSRLRAIARELQATEHLKYLPEVARYEAVAVRAASHERRVRRPNDHASTDRSVP